MKGSILEGIDFCKAHMFNPNLQKACKRPNCKNKSLKIYYYDDFSKMNHLNCSNNKCQCIFLRENGIF